MKCAPVLMIGFNRPDLTRGLLGCVRKARPSKLFFAVDSPRGDRLGEAEAVTAVQAVAREVDWPCEVETLFREKHLGCAQGVSSAITWALGAVPYCIILEDDCWPSEGFFRYASELLEKYRADDRIGMVSGFNPYGFQSDSKASYHFTTHADIWGWATWARVWKDYSLDVRPLLPKLDDILRRSYLTRRLRRIVKNYAERVAANPSTWDVQFALMAAERGYLSAAPRKLLVRNTGFGDARGSHTRGYCYDSTHYNEVWDGDEAIVHPQDVVPDVAAIRRTERRTCGILPRGLTYVGTKAPILSGLLTKCGRGVERVAPWLFRL